ncbi:Protein CBG10548 [Caenorhabditis briggsae]|uniref:Protein CBG10548 n=1 Tax=Caenorhabditis briggsae TaxID=6238 RepID=A8XBD8_CAEBR|nr:Protein CBG10548 [Caenorhabditis briggsae]CAP29953.2 Protein CBG10548 [Caenorhabditis briggsae]
MSNSNGDWSRAKRKRKTIEIQYSPGNSTLKVTKVTGKHLESMGNPVKNGYELFPEEAVYLVETGSGTILTPSGAEMSLLESYSILESNSISMSKYEIYKQVKLTGLVVLRPRKSTTDFEKARHVEQEIKQKFAEKTFDLLVHMNTVPQDRIPNANSFPSFVKKNNGDVSMRMRGFYFLKFYKHFKFPASFPAPHPPPETVPPIVSAAGESPRGKLDRISVSGRENETGDGFETISKAPPTAEGPDPSGEDYCRECGFSCFFAGFVFASTACETLIFIDLLSSHWSSTENFGTFPTSKCGLWNGGGWKSELRGHEWSTN